LQAVLHVIVSCFPCSLLSGEQPWQAGKVVRGKREGELCAHVLQAAQHGLAISTRLQNSRCWRDPRAPTRLWGRVMERFARSTAARRADRTNGAICDRCVRGIQALDENKGGRGLSATFKDNFSGILWESLPEHAKAKPIEIWFQSLSPRRRGMKPASARKAR
jgi:hypothetical protein